MKQRAGLTILFLAAAVGAVTFACSSDDTNIASTDQDGGGNGGGNGVDGSVATGDATVDDSSTSGNDSGGGSDTGAGGGDSGASDAGMDTGAVKIADASGLTGEIFHYGHFVAAGTNSFGRFMLPAVTENVLALGGNDVTAWDVSADGSKILFAVDTTLKGRFDLHKASSDGSGAGLLVALKNAGRTVSAAKFSPDASNIAFVSDDVTTGAKDVYLVPASGLSAPVLISPARGAGTANKLNADQIVWSRDGRYLAMTGDFNVDNAFQLWIYDTQTGGAAAEIVSVADVGNPAGPGGVTNPIGWDGAGNVYFTSSLGVDGAATSFKLYMATFAGGKQIVPGTVTNMEQAGSFGISPDGNTLVVSLTNPDGSYPYALYTMPAGGGATTALIANGFTYGNVTANPDFAKPMVFSPDGTKIAFVADYKAANADYELFVIDAAAGSTPTRLFKVTTGRDAKWIAWSLNNERVAFTSDEGAPAVGNARLFVTNDIVTADQPLGPIVSTPSGGGLVGAPPRWTN
jgi:Tol biopolymer transport system component